MTKQPNSPKLETLRVQVSRQERHLRLLQELAELGERLEHGGERETITRLREGRVKGERVG